MKTKFLFPLLILLPTVCFAQRYHPKTIFTDEISIRAIQVWKNKVFYCGTDSKFGYVSFKDSLDRNQIKISDKKLQFRTLAHDKNAFYAISIESPAYFFRIDKKSFHSEIVKIDSAINAFYDALHHHNRIFYAFSDPEDDLEFRMPTFYEQKGMFKFSVNQDSSLRMQPGEVAFAASNTNIASSKKFVWIATGGSFARIFRRNLRTEETEIFATPFVQGSSSQGIYSIDFYKDKFGIAVGGDYTRQEACFNNIATTTDAGKTWQIQASGFNAGYSTCVKIRPGSRGKEIIAVGDRHISLSQDFGKSWKVISDEKGFYTAAWIDRKTVVLAGKYKIATFKIY